MKTLKKTASMTMVLALVGTMTMMSAPSQADDHKYKKPHRASKQGYERGSQYANNRGRSDYGHQQGTKHRPKYHHSDHQPHYQDRHYSGHSEHHYGHGHDHYKKYYIYNHHNYSHHDSHYDSYRHDRLRFLLGLHLNNLDIYLRD